MDWNADGEIDNSELRLTGLILAQSALIGVAVGVFDSGLWLPAGQTEDSWVNGMTYSMAALAVQIVAFYIFKMFFEQSMKQRVSMQNRQKEYEMKVRGMQGDHEQRRMELQLRIQEMQLERDLASFRDNPSQSHFQQLTEQPPEIRQHQTPSGAMSLGLDSLAHQAHQQIIPPRNLSTSQEAYEWAMKNEVKSNEELSRMADELNNNEARLKKDGTPDLRYKGKEN
tara:strand:- start:228 stop:905 length:678 start_codon:yes stop_codon:yes gene_type:complete